VPLGREGREKVVQHCDLAEPAALAWAAQQGGLEIHVPMGRTPDPTVPTAVVFDLDPGAPADVLDCAWLALRIREAFDHLGLLAVPKTSGGKGLQLYVPVNRPDTTYEQTRAFSHALALTFERLHPDRVVSQQKKTLRPGKVLIDWSQNHLTKTTVVRVLAAGPRAPDGLHAPDLGRGRGGRRRRRRGAAAVRVRGRPGPGRGARRPVRRRRHRGAVPAAAEAPGGPLVTAGDAATHWAEQLAAWAIPEAIRAAAPRDPYHFDVARFVRAAERPRPAGPDDSPSLRRSHAAVPPGGSVLDVGCGAGAASLPLIPPAATLIGVDAAAGHARRLRRAAAARGGDRHDRHRPLAGRRRRGPGRRRRRVPPRALQRRRPGPVRDRADRPRPPPGGRRAQPAPSARVAAPYWRALHDLDRPAGPTSDDAVAVLRAAGIRAEVEHWDAPNRHQDEDPAERLAALRNGCASVRSGTRSSRPRSRRSRRRRSGRRRRCGGTSPDVGCVRHPTRASACGNVTKR
jgi:hypothetical protein